MSLNRCSDSLTGEKAESFLQLPPARLNAAQSRRTQLCSRSTATATPLHETLRDLKSGKHESERRQQLQNVKATEENITFMQPNTTAFTTHIVVSVTFG